MGGVGFTVFALTVNPLDARNKAYSALTHPSSVSLEAPYWEEEGN